MQHIKQDLVIAVKTFGRQLDNSCHVLYSLRVLEEAIQAAITRLYKKQLKSLFVPARDFLSWIVKTTSQVCKHFDNEPVTGSFFG